PTVGGARQHGEQKILRPVRILILIDVDITEAPLILLADCLIVAQKAVRQTNDLAEIESVVREKILLVLLVDALELALEEVMRRRLHLPRLGRVAFHAVDRTLNGFRV